MGITAWSALYRLIDATFYCCAMPLLCVLNLKPASVGLKSHREFKMGQATLISEHNYLRCTEHHKLNSSQVQLKDSHMTSQKLLHSNHGGGL